MKQRTPEKRKDTARENAELRARLEEAEGKLRALLAREVDAVVVSTEQGERIFTLEGAESPYRVLVEDLNEGAATLTAAGVILYSNRRFAEMIKRPLQQVIGSSIYTWIASEDRRVFEELLSADFERSRREEVRLCAKGGVEVPAYLSVSVFQADENPAAFCLVATDLTEQKRSEAIIASEMLSRAILEQAGEAMVVCDESARITRANAKAHALCGHDLMGRPFAEAFPLSTADGKLFSLADPQRGERFQGIEVDLEQDGEMTHLLLSAGPLVGGHHQPIGQVVTLTDITALKRMERQTLAAQAELRRLLGEANRSRRALLSVVEDQEAADKALRVSEGQLRLLLNSTAEGIYGLDVEGRCTFCNAASLRMLGYNQTEDLIGKPMHALIHSRREDGSEYSLEECPVCQAFHQGAESHVSDEILWRADGSSFPVEYWAYPIRNDGRVLGAVVAFTDITQRKRAEEQLRQAAKMEAIGRLAGGVAHDFNNLLTIINGYAQMILDHSPAGQSNRSQIEEILKAGDRAAALTRQLLTFSRRQIASPQVIDLNVVVANMERMLRRLIGEDVELVVSAGQDLSRIKADPGQIEQVVMNLAVNARDAMPKGGRLIVETRNIQLEGDDVVGHPDVVSGPYVMLAVADTGVGMDEETKSRLFEPFFTTKDQGKGTGLGLATVYGIVRQSGGSIWVYSESGKGTMFKIYFPPVTEAATIPALAKAQDSSAHRTETVLLVEDEEALRKMVYEILKEKGYQLLVAQNGAEALALSETFKGLIHLLITDVVMPGMGGRELSQRLVALRPQMKIIYMSGYTADAVVHNGVRGVDQAFLQKPFSPDTIARKVRDVLDGRTHVVTTR